MPADRDQPGDLSAAQAREVRDRLVRARDATTERQRSLDAEHGAIVDASSDANGDDEHDPEGATIAFEREQVSARSAAASGQVRAIDAAIDRIDDGWRGRCDRCGRPIGIERLRVRPSTTRCSTHA